MRPSMYPSVVDDNGPSRPIWLTLQQIFPLVCEGLPGTPLIQWTGWQTHRQGAGTAYQHSLTHCYCFLPNTPADRQTVWISMMKFSICEGALRKKKKKEKSKTVWEECLCGRSFFKYVDWQSACLHVLLSEGDALKGPPWRESDISHEWS